MMPQAGGWIQAPLHTAQLVRDPLTLMRRLAERYGRTFSLTLLDGPSVVTGDPGFIAEIFSGGGSACDAPNEIVTPLVGEHSIVLANGAPHRRKRKMLAPPFHGARMMAYGETIAQATERGMAAARPGAIVDVLGMTQQLSLEVILRAAFGVTDPRRVEALRQAITAVVSGFPAWLMFAPALQRPVLGRGPWVRHQNALARLKAMLQEEIDRARSAPAGSRDDVLAMMLEASDETGQPMPDPEIVDELRTLVIAGHETTATTLGWALWQLHRHPEALERLRQELDGLGADAPPAQYAKLPWLAAVCDEVMRMHPIVPIFRRRVIADTTLAGHTLAAGTLLSPAVLMLHYDASLYADPTAFRPQRFIDRKYSPSEFMPFGGGNRRCLGAAFAQFELQVALGALLRHHAFEAVPGPDLRLVMHGVTTRTHAPVTLRYAGRRSDRAAA